MLPWQVAFFLYHMYFLMKHRFVFWATTQYMILSVNSDVDKRPYDIHLPILYLIFTLAAEISRLVRSKNHLKTHFHTYSDAFRGNLGFSIFQCPPIGGWTALKAPYYAHFLLFVFHPVEKKTTGTTATITKKPCFIILLKMMICCTSTCSEGDINKTAEGWSQRVEQTPDSGYCD